MSTFAVLDGTGTIINNVVICAPAQALPAWLEIDGLSPVPGIGWTLVAGTWTPPAVPVAQTNQATITQNVLNSQAQIEAWIAANPAGAVLTAGQTLVLAKMLNGLCRILLQQFSATTGT